MDLDKTKEAWSKADLHPSIEKETIAKMLDNKGKNAFRKLLLYEKIGLVVLLLLIPFMFLQSRHSLSAPYSLFTEIWFTSFCILGFFWQIYKIRLLKKVEPQKINILASLKYITQYKRYIRYEFFIGMVWGIVFLTSIVLSPLSSPMGWKLIVAVFCLVAFFTLSVFLMYRSMYYNNIRKVEESIKEVREYEQEEEEQLHNN